MANESFTGDGAYRTLNQNGGDVPHLPFLQYGNLTNYAVERFFEQELGSFSTPALGASASGMGGQSSQGDDLYFVSQSPLDPGKAAYELAAVSRMLVPEWSNFFYYKGSGFALPNLADFVGASGDADVTVNSNGFIEVDFTRPGGSLPESSSRTTIEGEFTFLTSAAIDWSDDIADVLSALQAVDAGFTAAAWESQGGYNPVYLELTHNDLASVSASDFDLSSLITSLYPSLEVIGYADDGVDTIYLYQNQIIFEWADHEFTDGETVDVVSQGSVLNPLVVTVLDKDTLSLPKSSAARALIYYGIDLGVDVADTENYYMRTKPVVVRQLFEFFIPGVTAGISTIEDIPERPIFDVGYRFYEYLGYARPWIPVSSSGFTYPYPGVVQRITTYVRTESLFD